MTLVHGLSVLVLFSAEWILRINGPEYQRIDPGRRGSDARVTKR